MSAASPTLEQWFLPEAEPAIRAARARESARRSRPLAFEAFNQALEGFPGPLRCLAEALEPQAGEWRLVALEGAERLEGGNGWDATLDYVPKRRRTTVGHGTATSNSTSSGRVRDHHGDPLKAIPAYVYLPALAGVDVESSGRCRCPMPDHEDTNPSAKAYGTTWTCFACGAGGTIIDVAAALYGLQPTGPGYRQIRQRLLAELGLARSTS